MENNNKTMVDINEYSALLHEMKNINGVLNGFSKMNFSALRFFEDEKNTIKNMIRNCNVSVSPVDFYYEEFLDMECTKMREIIFDTELKLIAKIVKSSLEKREC